MTWSKKSRFKFQALALSYCASMCCLDVCAKDPLPESCAPDCVEIGQWSVKVGVGLGSRSNPVIGQDDVPIYLAPEVSFYGDKFFVENLDVGYTLINDRRNQFNLLMATPGLDHIYFDDDIFAQALIERQVRNNPTTGDVDVFLPGLPDLVDPDVPGLPEPGLPGIQSIPDSIDSADAEVVSHANPVLPKRRIAIMSGFEYIRFYDWGQIHLQALDDFSTVHHGEQFRVALTLPINFYRNQFLLTGGATYQSAQLLNYYYGVSDEGGYLPGKGVSQFFRADWRYPISKKWTLRAVLSYKQLDDVVQDSPLVVDDHSTTYFLGGVYHF